MKNIICILSLFTLSFSLKAQTFYKTPSGKKYHVANCHTVKNVSETISVEEITALGLQPCKICNPQAIVINNATSIKKVQGQKITVQCIGYTKKGNRCLHKTSIGNGYCYQHQP